MDTVDKINNLSKSDFISVFGNIFEKTGWIAEKAYMLKPFSDYDTLKNAKDLSGKIDNFNSSPTIKIGMFTKLILNHNIFHQKLEKFLTKEEPNYSIESTKESSEFIVYNRAWFYLNQVDMSQKEDVFAILDFNPKILNNALESALLYFQNRNLR